MHDFELYLLATDNHHNAATPLQYPCSELVLNERVAIADGIDAVRVAVPWALNHVNCWLLDDAFGSAQGSTLIDTGINDSATSKVWQSVLGDTLPARLILTHYHPDHCGQAGWFAGEGVECFGHSDEIAVMNKIWQSSTEDYVAEFAGWYSQHGLDDSHIRPLSHIGHGYRKTVASLPAADLWNCLEAGDQIQIGQRSFEVLVGRGHAPAMLMLFCASDALLIAADQVLPRISPNVSVLPGAPDQNPLAGFMATLNELLALPEHTLVLPSHGDPFVGLHSRINALLEHHELRLNELRAVCTKRLQAADVLSTLFPRKLDVQQMSFALGEAVAHLRYLVELGELRELTEPSGIWYQPA